MPNVATEMAERGGAQGSPRNQSNTPRGRKKNGGNRNEGISRLVAQFLRTKKGNKDNGGTLDAKRKPLTLADLKALGEGLKDDHSLTQILVAVSSADTGAMQAFVEGLNASPSIKILGISGSGLESEAASVLMSSLPSGLEELTLACNATEDAVRALGARLQQCTQLRILRLYRMPNADDWAPIADAIREMKELTSLALTDSDVGQNGGLNILEGISGCKELVELRVENCKLGEIGASQIATFLERDTCNLKLLLANDNQFGPNGANAFARALGKNACLETLAINRNDLGPKGGAAIAVALRRNRSLRSLSITENGLGADGMEAFAATIRSDTTMEELKLYGNTCGSDAAISIAEALEMNKTLHSLFFGGNEAGPVASKRFVQALKRNKTLKTLRFAANSPGSAGFELLQCSGGGRSVMGLNEFATIVDRLQNDVVAYMVDNGLWSILDLPGIDIVSVFEPLESLEQLFHQGGDFTPQMTRGKSQPGRRSGNEDAASLLQKQHKQPSTHNRDALRSQRKLRKESDLALLGRDALLQHTPAAMLNFAHRALRLAVVFPQHRAALHEGGAALVRGAAALVRAAPAQHHYTTTLRDRIFEPADRAQPRRFTTLELALAVQGGLSEAVMDFLAVPAVETAVNQLWMGYLAESEETTQHGVARLALALLPHSLRRLVLPHRILLQQNPEARPFERKVFAREEVDPRALGRSLFPPSVRHALRSVYYFAFVLLLFVTVSTEAHDVTPSALEIFTAYVALCLLIQEVVEVRDKRTKYRLGFWNFLDWAIAVLFLVITVLRIAVYADGSHADGDRPTALRWANDLLIPVSLMTAFRFLAHFSVHRALGPLLVSIGQMMTDLAHFIVLFIVVLVGYSIAFTVAFRDEPTLQNSFGTPFRAVDALFFSVFDAQEISVEQVGVRPTIGRLLSYSFLVLSAVLLINLLIAMFSHTFQQVRDNATAVWRLEWADAAHSVIPRSPPPFLPFVLLFRSARKALRGGKADGQSPDRATDAVTAENSATDGEVAGKRARQLASAAVLRARAENVDAVLVSDQSSEEARARLADAQRRTRDPLRARLQRLAAEHEGTSRAERIREVLDKIRADDESVPTAEDVEMQRRVRRRASAAVIASCLPVEENDAVLSEMQALSAKMDRILARIEAMEKRASSGGDRSRGGIGESERDGADLLRLDSESIATSP